MAYPSEYYTKAQEIIDKRRFENSVKAEKRLREVRSKIPEIVEIDSKLSKTIDELVKIILSDKPDKKQLIEQVKEENLALQERMKELLRKTVMLSIILTRYTPAGNVTIPVTVTEEDARASMTLSELWRHRNSARVCRWGLPALRVLIYRCTAIR